LTDMVVSPLPFTVDTAGAEDEGPVIVKLNVPSPPVVFLIILTLPGTSSFVIVHVTLSPSLSVTVPPSCVGQPVPVMLTNWYPARPASSITYGVLENAMKTSPEMTGEPFIVMPKLLMPAVPPLLLVTFLTSVSVGATSSLIIVHIFVSPLVTVPVQSAERPD